MLAWLWCAVLGVGGRHLAPERLEAVKQGWPTGAIGAQCIGRWGSPSLEALTRSIRSPASLRAISSGRRKRASECGWKRAGPGCPARKAEGRPWGSHLGVP